VKQRQVCTSTPFGWPFEGKALGKALQPGEKQDKSCKKPRLAGAVSRNIKILVLIHEHFTD
jgi:hypothetical protein